MLHVKSEFGETSIGIYVTPLNTKKEIVIEIRMISKLHMGRFLLAVQDSSIGDLVTQ